MNYAVKVYTFLAIAFILLCSASSMLGEPFNIIAEIFCYGVLVFVGYLTSRKLKTEREERAGVAESESTLFSISPARLAEISPLVMPTLGIIFLISYLTSLLLGLLGLSASTVEDAPLPSMILLHAVMPAILEEMLFRYLPMKLIAPYSKRLCVVISSAYFALIHLNLFQLPYALLAGAIFILVDVWADSVLPSIILHLFNNVISIFWIKYSSFAEFSMWFVIILVSLATVSLIPIIIKRRDYITAIRSVTEKGETLTDRYALTLFIIFTSFMTLLNHL